MGNIFFLVGGGVLVASGTMLLVWSNGVLGRTTFWRLFANTMFASIMVGAILLRPVGADPFLRPLVGMAMGFSLGIFPTAVIILIAAVRKRFFSRAVDQIKRTG